MILEDARFPMCIEHITVRDRLARERALAADTDAARGEVAPYWNLHDGCRNREGRFFLQRHIPILTLNLFRQA